MNGQNYDPTGVEFYSIDDLSFSSGTTLHDVRVAYRSYNPASTAGVVLIPTCYSGLINTTLTFTSAPFDALAPYHVVVVAMLGNGESASPSNKAFFPEPGELRYEDVVRAQHALVTQHLRVSTPLEAVRIVVICSAARTSLHNYAFLEGPIAALTSSIDYIAWRAMKDKIARGENVGINLKEVVPKKGLRAFARAYGAWLTSTAWFRERRFTQMDGHPASVEAWMQLREQGYLAGTPRTCSDLGGKVPDDNLYTTALAGIQARVLLMPCRTDQYFPPEDSEIEMKHLRRGRLAVIESVWGHVAGGGLNPEDTEFMNARIAELMKED
ncbi:hypothetical protein CLAIMM_06392 [Cladophialophora immunda]|nr:hypothetical protein CLAIMM_06392 [Cladophialophora immunda]